MAKIAKQLTELIGHTPLLELTNYEKALGLEAKIIAKLEYFNPLGSVKDRVAAAMIEQGIKDGKINQDTIIIEPTSGNTGIGLAFVAASKGLHLILIMPDTMSVERRKIADLFRLGFDVVIGKCIAGRADERAAGKLPDVRKASHARDDAVVGAYGYLVAQIVREGVASLLACRALLRAVVAGAIARASDHRAPACRQDQCTHACEGLCCDSLHAILLVLLVRLTIVAPLVFVD